MNNPNAAWRPERPIEIIAGTPPGGGLDRTARALAMAIESLAVVEVPVTVINIPGDGSRKMWEYVDRRAGDAHVLAVSSPNLTTDNLTGQTAFDHNKYTPLAILHTEYIAFIARADSPFGDGRQLMQRLGRDAGSVTIALATSTGNPNHIALARITKHAGGNARALKVTAFDSARHAVAAVVTGDCAIGAVSAASAVPELTDGTLRALAVSAPHRLAPPFATAPTWLEQGADCVIGAWRGINGTPGLTAAQIAFWDPLLATATASRVWQAAIAQHHWSAMYVGCTELAAYLPRERAEMSAMLGELGLLPQSA